MERLDPQGQSVDATVLEALSCPQVGDFPLRLLKTWIEREPETRRERLRQLLEWTVWEYSRPEPASTPDTPTGPSENGGSNGRGLGGAPPARRPPPRP